MTTRNNGNRARDAVVGEPFESLLDTFVGEAAQAGLRDVRESAREALRSGRGKLRDARTSIEARIRERPLQSLAIAAAVGIALGWLLRRRT